MAPTRIQLAIELTHIGADIHCLLVIFKVKLFFFSMIQNVRVDFK